MTKTKVAPFYLGQRILFHIALLFILHDKLYENT